MKVHLRDRITSLLGIGLLAVLAAASYYYAVKAGLSSLKTETNRESPNFVSTNITVTEFDELGVAKSRVFAEHAKHYADGRMDSIKPRYVSLNPNEPQTKARADFGSSPDDGVTVHFKGNVVVTREGDEKNAPLSFTSDHVTVYPDDSRMETDAPVRMTQGGDVTTGIGLKMDNVDRTVVILKDVHTVTMPKNAQSKN